LPARRPRKRSWRREQGRSALKVAWDNSFARRNEGGTGTYAARLLEQFTSRSDLQIEILKGWSIDSRRGKLVGRALRVTRDLLWTHAYLPCILWKEHFDLLHAPAFISPVRSPCPVVITIHDITYLLFPSHFARWWVAYLKSVMPPAVRSAAAIICGSENSKRDLTAAYGVAGDRVHVIPYGVDLERFHPGASLDRTWAERLGIREGYVLHVGALSSRKNIPALLRAFAEIRSKSDWGARQLVLAGSESPGLAGAGEIYRTIEQLELTGSVILPGHVPDQHLPGLYAHAGVLVMPSLYEGFGFPILESMAVGTPVVASDTSSIPEIADGAAILVPPHDQHALANAIREVVENRAIASHFRDQGLARARQFTWERTAAETMDVYRTVARS
jgi:glycosyltransferase involved in cell wall biosynthesis